MNYSGRTTCYAHKFDNWKEKRLNIGAECIQKVIVFNVQWSNCPVEVEEQVKKLWQNNELGNNHYYYNWGDNPEDCTAGELSTEECECLCCNYPIINDYLRSRNITKCLIHWWW